MAVEANAKVAQEVSPPEQTGAVSEERYWGENDYGGHQFAARQFGGYLPDGVDVRDQPLIPPVGSNALRRKLLNISAEEEQEHTWVQDARLAEKFELGDGDTRKWEVPVFDQRPKPEVKPYQSCVSCAIAAVLAYSVSPVQAQNDLARLFVFYNARLLEGNENNDDAGTSIRAALKGLRKFGGSTEPRWPYPDHEVTERPEPAVYDDAALPTDIEYRRIFRLTKEGSNDLSDLDLTPVRRALANGFPVICGFTVYPSFRDASDDGTVHMPVESDVSRPEGEGVSAADKVTTFGHAAVIIGYDGDSFTLVNSWGKDWGIKDPEEERGWFTMPAEYLADASLASDFWVLRFAGPNTT